MHSWACRSGIRRRPGHSARPECNEEEDPMSDLVKPHGGQALRPLLLEGEARRAELARAASMRRVPLGSREFGDLMMLGIGGFTPLEGFMTHADWKSVCQDYRLLSGVFWPVPITLSVDQE